MILQILLTITNKNENSEEVVFEYMGNSKITSERGFKELVNSITAIKGDWYVLNNGVHVAGFYVNMHLMYIDKVDWSQIDAIKKKFLQICSDGNANSDYMDLIPDSTIFLSTKNNIYGNIQFDTISSLLNSSNIFYKTNTREIHDIECGAGHWYEDFSLFIISSIASGITYDIIKSTIMSLPPDQLKEISYIIFDKIKFKLLRNELANRIGCNPKYLLLKYMHKTKVFDVYVFIYKGKEVKIKVSKWNLIKKFEIN